MTNQANLQRSSTGMKRLLIGVIMLQALYFLCLMPDVIIGLLYVVALMMLGWISFLVRNGHDLRIDGTGIAVGMIAFGLLITWLNYAGRQFIPNRKPTLWNTTRCVLGCSGIFLASVCLIGFTHEVSWAFRSEIPWLKYDAGWDFPYRTRSKHNLKQIGLSLHNYADIYMSIPVGGHFRPNGIAGHGWMTNILPFIDQTPLYEQIDLRVPWYAAVNQKAMGTRVNQFEHPKIDVTDFPRGGYAPASYSTNSRVMNVNLGLAFKDIPDGTSNTFMAGEVKDNLRPWGDASNWRNLDLGINQSPNGFGSPSKGGAHLLMMDGSVRFVGDETSPRSLHAMATPNADDIVEDF